MTKLANSWPQCSFRSRPGLWSRISLMNFSSRSLASFSLPVRYRVHWFLIRLHSSWLFSSVGVSSKCLVPANSRAYVSWRVSYENTCELLIVMIRWQDYLREAYWNRSFSVYSQLFSWKICSVRHRTVWQCAPCEPSSRECSFQGRRRSLDYIECLKLKTILTKIKLFFNAEVNEYTESNLKPIKLSFEQVSFLNK